MPDFTKPELKKEDRIALYATRRHLGSTLEERLGLRIPFDVYLQDPLVAAENPAIGIAKDFTAPWEPGLSDGPTSARFAVVDYDNDTGLLADPATWDADANVFRDPSGKAVDRHTSDTPQFRQVNVWAHLQAALDFFENGNGLGRRLPWGFEGNRLLVVPHAGNGENAFYDRASKSLQFYYFDALGSDGVTVERVYTSLSADIVHHEFGHAVLDAIRPLYQETANLESNAFHEFTGDLTAILIIFRDTEFREQVAKDTKGNLSVENVLNSIAKQFGNAINGTPYLRSGINTQTMNDLRGTTSHHKLSEVMTGAMFAILTMLNDHYRLERGRSVKQALWDTVQRIQRIAIQPFDFLPPVDVTYRDYAIAVLRNEEISNPVDPHNMRPRIFDVFLNRGILDESDRDALLTERYVYDRPDLNVFHDMNIVARSTSEAYRFLDDNRRAFLIPRHQDFIISDLYAADKRTREAQRRPTEITIQYTWREDLPLNGARFGEFDGQITSLLCGGTLVFDESGALLSWSRKPGTEHVDTSGGKMRKMADADLAAGNARREASLNDLADHIAKGNIGSMTESAQGFIANRLPPLTVRTEDGSLRFELTPHLGFHHGEEDCDTGGRSWQVSS